jgi:hypothetical protein
MIFPMKLTSPPEIKSKNVLNEKVFSENKQSKKYNERFCLPFQSCSLSLQAYLLFTLWNE